ncbi:hypothetical protein FIBSPDRAFT_165238 [Athelia psychrophila]|uniref:Uncharacterized protein n=1 Tax=Athelia psychrophila TaxID=1759441 RepID=A0A166B3G7_9AGAM|nr:hypothetical protein FIBSPDRAFT_165238 [Fibularhizoctonia sp. CBS 109695]
MSSSWMATVEPGDPRRPVPRQHRSARVQDELLESALIRPTDSTCACTSQTIHLVADSATRSSTPAPYIFNNILTGTFNNHVRAAMRATDSLSSRTDRPSHARLSP